MTNFVFLKVIILFQFALHFSFIFLLFEKNNSYNLKNNDDYNYYENIEEIDENQFPSLNPYTEIELEDQKFLYGLIRRFKPKKLLELGVSAGGSSSLILNAIKDIPNSKLYSIDRRNEWYKNATKKVGWVVKEYFPRLANKWSLFSGRNAAEFLEVIGNNIDFVFIDTVHTTPGEMLNWLEVLPFLKEESIVVFHDIFLMFTPKYLKADTYNYSNNQLLCYIRGKLIMPSSNNNIFSRNIGAIKLEKNQKNYYKQYFIALGNQWNYFPTDYDLNILRKHFKKYFRDELVEIYDAAVQKNKMRFNLTN